jgi:hypothetical protein
MFDIIASCPNTQILFVDRGDGGGSPGTIFSDQLQELQIMLCACTRIKSLHYSAATGRPTGGYRSRIEVADPQETLSDWISNQTHIKQSLKQLHCLGLDSPSGWLLGCLSQYLSFNLTSLHLGEGSFYTLSRTPLFDISQHCRKLKVLVVKYSLVTTHDLEKACQVWASTLETLKVSLVAETRDWVSQLIPHLEKLKVLHLGIECYVPVDGVNGIAKAESPFEEIIIGDMGGLCETDPDCQIASDSANEALAKMIEGHSSTLRLLHIHLHIGEIVMQSCKKAKGLRYLNVSFAYEPQPSDIDGLLDACPQLNYFSRGFNKYSDRWSEWEDRRPFTMERRPSQEVLIDDELSD